MTATGRGAVTASLLATLLSVAAADESIPAARRTETVELIARALPSVVTIVGERRGPNGQREGRFGSGSIIHPDGFVLTNDHVIANLDRIHVMRSDGTALPVRVVARFPHEDLAVIQLKSSEPLPALRLGRSHDLLLGEPALVIGSPGGLERTVSSGLVSGINRSTRNEWNFLPWVIQTSAPVSRGSSGGPLLNALGEQIGVVATIKPDLQNVSFSIAIDHVRQLIPQMLAMEERGGFWLGIECDPLRDPAVVTRVVEGSPADRAGLQIGDELQSIGGVSLTSGAHLHLALTGRQPGEVLSVTYVREGNPATRDVTLADLPLADPLPAEGLKPGLQYALYRGTWSQLPEFEALEPAQTGRTPAVDLSIVPPPLDQFALRFEGAIEIPRDGMYAFYTGSDDGSRLWIGERLVVDNDGNHPARQSGGLIRLKQGRHPLRVEYYEGTGAEFLEVLWEGPGIVKGLIPPEVLSSSAANEPAADDTAGQGN